MRLTQVEHESNKTQSYRQELFIPCLPKRISQLCTGKMAPNTRKSSLKKLGSVSKYRNCQQIEPPYSMFRLFEVKCIVLYRVYGI